MTSAIDLVADPNLGIDPITAMTARAASGQHHGYTNSELAHFRIGHDNIHNVILYILAFGKKNHPERHNFRNNISDAIFEDSIDKTNTFTLVVHDPDWDLLNTGALDKPIDINPGKIPDLWYRRDSFEVNNDDITITFITRNASYMSQYKRPKKANRKNTTRAEFILSLARAVKETKIPFVCPQLHVKQKIARTEFPNEIARRKGREHGFTASDHINVKGVPSSPAQRKVIEKVILAGEDLKMPGLVIVSAVMCATQESTCSENPQPPNPPYVGAFQQNRGDGWPGTGDAYKDAKGNGKIGVKQGGYYGYAYGIWKAHGGDMDLGLLVATTQGVIGSTNPLNNGYAQSTNRWRGDAQHAVNAFGGIDVNDPGSATHTVEFKQKYEFIVGPPDGDRNENYLACTYRLADEVQWSAFWVRNALHFISEDDLFKSKPQTNFRRASRGIEGVSFGWDTQQRLNQMTLSVRMNNWVCPLGTVIHFEEGGQAEGRWLVTNIRRSMFDELGEITLSKPMREKLEPANEPGERQVRNQGERRSITDVGGYAGGEQIPGAHAGYPVPKPTSIGGIHDTSGLPGYPARDYFAPAGSACVSPVDGKITRFSGHDPALGAIEGAGGPLGWSVYITETQTGWSYYLTHMGSRLCFEGETVQQGEVIGTVANYHKYGRADHIHMGVHGYIRAGVPVSPPD